MSGNYPHSGSPPRLVLVKRVGFKPAGEGGGGYDFTPDERGPPQVNSTRVEEKLGSVVLQMLALGPEKARELLSAL